MYVWVCVCLPSGILTCFKNLYFLLSLNFPKQSIFQQQLRSSIKVFNHTKIIFFPSFSLSCFSFLFFFLLIVRINCPQALMKCFCFYIFFYFVGIPFIYYNMSCCFLKAKKSLLENHSFVSAWQTASNFRFTRSLNHKGHAKIPFLFSPQNSIFLTWILFSFFYFLLFSHIFWEWYTEEEKSWKLFYLFLWIKKIKNRKKKEAELLPQQH